MSTPALTLLPPYDPIKNRALFHFDGVKQNANRPAGGIWTNTERGYELSDDELVEVVYRIDFVTPVKLEAVNFAGLDFMFAQVTDDSFGPEIHRAYYEPINRDLYYSLVSDSRLDYYKSKENLVWAVNIPTDVAHAYEKVDFLKAYPEFKTWAQSGDKQAQNWYRNGDRENTVRK